MKNAASSRTASNRFAVSRKYEPSRIEHELLAQVFEVISHQQTHCGDELDQATDGTIDGALQVGVEATARRGRRGPHLDEVAQCDAMEPAA